MIHRIEILTRAELPDPVGRSLLFRIKRFSAVSLTDIRTCAVYAFDSAALNGSSGLNGSGRLDVQALGEDLFTDPILHHCRVDGAGIAEAEFDWYVEVGFRPGVTDNVGRTAQESLEYRLGHAMAAGNHVHTATGYFLRGSLRREQVEALAEEWLYNDLIQQALILSRAELAKEGAVDEQASLFHLPKVALHTTPHVERFALEDPALVTQLSDDRLLAISPAEAEVIGAYYRRADTIAARQAAGLGTDATDVELEVLAQTWSEHCKHKIFNAEIAYTDEHGRRETVRSLFKTYIQGATKTVRAALGARDFCQSVFTDNAGVIRFDDRWSLVFKVETHNSPSALDPYGGALTGIVGVNRDPFGTGRGAELLFNTDVFCFASPFYEGKLPPRLLHPRRIYEGVRLGVEHGGNKSGVPTVNGSVSFHDRFVGKPLVFCGTGGLLPAKLGDRPGWEKWVHPGAKIVMVGGRIGADGIHGATFSSIELNEAAPATAVQIGDPIVQKKMFDFLLLARDRGLYTAITDNGAGGLSSSVGEMATLSGGADIALDLAPLKYPGLQPWEIFVSEAQERMTLAVAPDQIDALLALSRDMDVESTVLGEFTASGMLRATYQGETVALLDMQFLHEGLPPMHITARWEPPAQVHPRLHAPQDLTAMLTALLGRLNVCSKESMVRQYDHEVQGHSVLKPFTGAANDGPGDAAVLRPVLDSLQGVAVAHGLAPRYGELDTHAMAQCAVDEAVRNAVAVGADPDRIAGLDNFCWCDPLPSPTNLDAEYKAAQLVRAVRAVHDLAVAYGVPLISGKDSMKNDYVSGMMRISVPPTLLFSVLGIVPDVRQAVTMDTKAPGDVVYLLGDTRPELGQSELFNQMGIEGGIVPRVTDPARAKACYRALHAAIRGGEVRSAHDLSDGGLAVALAESAFAGELGIDVNLGALAAAEGLAPWELLFSESPSRLVVTVAPAHSSTFEQRFSGLPLHRLGTVTTNDRLTVYGPEQSIWIDGNLGALKEAWQKTLREL
jgi:phosphoribosylformylglycinamidine synthase